VARLTQEIAVHFEGFVRRAPEQWHLFQPNWPSERPPEPAAAGRPSGRGGSSNGSATRDVARS
jgi:hypothetical protein